MMGIGREPPAVNPAHSDGCTWWPDLWYRACCDAHDAAYADGTITLWHHIELGACVIETAPAASGILAAIIAALMIAGTTAWHVLRHKLPGLLRRD